MGTKLQHMHIEKELEFPLTCPLCDDIFQEGLKTVCQFTASDMPKDDFAIHIHVVKFFSCVPCGANYTDKGEASIQQRLIMIVRSAVPGWCLCRSFANVGDQVVGRN